MEHKEFKELIPDYISDNLSSDKHEEFEMFLLNNPKLIKEIDEVKSVWNEMDNLNIPEPSAAMDAGFYSVLNAEMEKAEFTKPSISNQIKSFFNIQGLRPLGRQLALGAGLLLIGLFIGNRLVPNRSKIDKSIVKVNPTIEQAALETDNLRTQLVLALADESSANKRLKAVSEVNKMNNATEQVILALFKMLNSDPNVNVRLAAIEALAQYGDKPKVREGLVKSIVHQDSPLIQTSLADLMVAMQERRSLDPFKELIRTKDLNKAAKQKIEESIEFLI